MSRGAQQLAHGGDLRAGGLVGLARRADEDRESTLLALMKSRACAGVPWPMTARPAPACSNCFRSRCSCTASWRQKRSAVVAQPRQDDGLLHPEVAQTDVIAVLV